MNEDHLFHVHLPKDLSIRYAILPGDPGRVSLIASQLENPAPLVSNREFTSYAGALEGETVLVTSTGIGGPSAAIALWELADAGVTHFIRVGTCGAMQPEIGRGDLIIPTGAIRMEGTTRELVPIEFPAVPDFGLTQALRQAAAGRSFPYHLGVVQSKDSFYSQHSPGSMPAGPELQYKWNAWIKAGALASEMECAALFIAAAIRRVKAGAVLTCLWNQMKQNEDMSGDVGSERAVFTAISALKQMILDEKEHIL